MKYQIRIFLYMETYTTLGIFQSKFFLCFSCILLPFLKSVLEEIIDLLGRARGEAIGINKHLEECLAHK